MQGLHLFFPLYLLSCQIPPFSHTSIIPPTFSHPAPFLPFLSYIHSSPFLSSCPIPPPSLILPHSSPFLHPSPFLPFLASFPIPPLSCILPHSSPSQPATISSPSHLPPPFILPHFPLNLLPSSSHHPPLLTSFSSHSPPFQPFWPSLLHSSSDKWMLQFNVYRGTKIKMYVEANLQGRIF